MSGPPGRSPHHPRTRRLIGRGRDSVESMHTHQTSDTHACSLDSSLLSPRFDSSLIEYGATPSSSTNSGGYQSMNINPVSSVVNCLDGTATGGGTVYPHHINQIFTSNHSSHGDTICHAGNGVDVTIPSSINPMNNHYDNMNGSFAYSSPSCSINMCTSGHVGSGGGRYVCIHDRPFSRVDSRRSSPPTFPTKMRHNWKTTINSDNVNVKCCEEVEVDNDFSINHKHVNHNAVDDDVDIACDGRQNGGGKSDIAESSRTWMKKKMHHTSLSSYRRTSPCRPFNDQNDKGNKHRIIQHQQDNTKKHGEIIKESEYLRNGLDDGEQRSNMMMGIISSLVGGTSECDTDQIETSHSNTVNGYTPSRLSSLNTFAVKNEKEEKEDMDVKLRKLILHCIASSHSAPSPSTAVFYGSTLFTRTHTDENAFLYARALAANNEGRRAVRVLDKAGLLTSASRHRHTTVSNHDHKHRFEGELCGGNVTTRTDVGSIIKRTKIRIESAILASRCLSKVGEWEEALGLLENECHYPVMNDGDPRECNHPVHHSSETFIESGDDSRLLLLAEYVRPSTLHGDFECCDEVHLIARLCSLRGIAYDELSNPTRATCFLVTALRIDSKCVEAWDYLFSRHLLTREKEWLLVMGLKFADGMDWLRNVYIARLTMVHDNDLGIFDGVLRGVQDGDKLVGKRISKDENTTRMFPQESLPMCFYKGDRVMNIGIERHDQGVIDASSIRMHETPASSIGLIPMHVHHTSSAYIFPGDINEKMKENTVVRNEKVSIVHKGGGGGDTTFVSDAVAVTEVENAFRNLSLKYYLSRSPEVLSLAAVHAFDTHDLPSAYLFFKALANVDPLCTTASHVHVATLTCLGHTRPLFRLAHDLVEANPKSAYAWYAIGCYYYSCGRYDLAQRHFCRATRLDPRSAECWMAFGCAFAACDESDQALASFRAARRLHPGSHHPMLYMGMEYLRTNHLILAGHFLRSARGMGTDDPLCYNELGVLSYRKGMWEEAVRLFLMTLRLCVINTRGSNKQLTILELDGVAWYEKMVEENILPKPRLDGVELPVSSVKMAMSDLREVDTSTSSYRRHFLLSDVECIELCRDKCWEPTIFNLGQSYRKSKKYSEAILCFEKCRSIYPGQAAPYTALGFTKHLVGDLNGAIESYHQALSLKPDEPVATEMLNRALHETLDDMDISHFTEASNDRLCADNFPKGTI